MKVYKVIMKYNSSFSNFIKANIGDEFELHHEDAEWKGWIWCINKKGEKAWIPKRYLEIYNNKGILIQSYSNKELNVDINEELEIINEESGWFWCRTKNGDEGWVPIRNLEEI